MFYKDERLALFIRRFQTSMPPAGAGVRTLNYKLLAAEFFIASGKIAGAALFIPPTPRCWKTTEYFRRSARLVDLGAVTYGYSMVHESAKEYTRFHGSPESSKGNMDLSLRWTRWNSPPGWTIALLFLWLRGIFALLVGIAATPRRARLGRGRRSASQPPMIPQMELRRQADNFIELDELARC